MRTEAHRFKNGVVNFAVNQNKIRLDVAITAIIQRPDQGMIDGMRGQSLVLDQKSNDCRQKRIKFLVVYS